MNKYFIRIGFLALLFGCNFFNPIRAEELKSHTLPHPLRIEENQVILLTPSGHQVTSDWVPLRWILSSPKSNEKYYLFVKDLSSNTLLIDYLEIPATKTSFGLDSLFPGHLYEWGIKAVNIFDTSISAITSTSFSRSTPSGQSIELGTLSSTYLCPGETLSLPYSISGFANTTLTTYIVANEPGFLADVATIQNPQSLGVEPTQAGQNLHIRSCVVEDNMLGCSDASQPFTVGAAGAVSVLNPAGELRSLACTGTTVQLAAQQEGVLSGQSRSYYWLKDGCERIAGATDSTLTVLEEGRYQVVITSADGCTSISSEHVVTYRDALTPTLETNQLNEFRCDWSDAYVTTNVVGTENTYTWRRNGVTIPAPSQPRLSINEPGTYEVTVSGPTCWATSAPLEVKASTGIALTIHTTESSICVNQPQDTYLYVEIAGETDQDELSYQWLRNGVPVAGATTRFIYTRAPGSYALKVLTGSCAMVSNTVVIDFGSPARPIILNGATPVSATVYGCTEESLLLKADLPTGTLVRWKQDETLDNTFALSRTITASGTYRAVVFTSDAPGACYTESDPVEVVLGSTTDVLLEGDSLLCGWNNTMLRYAGSTDSREFQWYKDGNKMEGNTYPTFLINDPGTYSLQVKTHYPSGCTGMSRPVTVSSFSENFPRSITVAGGPERCAGLGVPLSFSPGLTGVIQWKRNGESITGANSAYYHAFSSGTYTVEVTMNACHFVSPPIPIQIKELATAQLSGSTTTPAPNAPTPLQVQLTGEGPYSLTFTDGTVVDNIQTSYYERVVTPSMTTTYQLASVSNGCGTGLRSGVALISVDNEDIYTVQSGSWQDTSTWSCHCIPKAGNNVEIRQGHTVTINEVEAHARNITLSGGQLTYTEAGAIKLGN